MTIKYTAKRERDIIKYCATQMVDFALTCLEMRPRHPEMSNEQFVHYVALGKLTEVTLDEQEFNSKNNNEI